MMGSKTKFSRARNRGCNYSGRNVDDAQEIVGSVNTDSKRWVANEKAVSPFFFLSLLRLLQLKGPRGRLVLELELVLVRTVDLFNSRASKSGGG